MTDHTTRAPADGLVSIIVPVYRVEDFLPRCLDSILSQTYQNFELILVDDGSPDGCGEICDSYAKVDPRVIAVHQSNQGLSSARNHGLEISVGDCVAFIDSDDWVSDRYLEVLMSLIREHDSDIAICQFLRVTDDSDVPETREDASVTFLSNTEALDALYHRMIEQFTVAWAKVYRRRLFADLSFPAGMMHEDVHVSCPLLYTADRIAFTTEHLYFYRQRPGSIMSQSRRSAKSSQDALKAFLSNSQFLRRAGLEELHTTALGKAVAHYFELIRNFPPEHATPGSGWSRSVARRTRWSLMWEAAASGRFSATKMRMIAKLLVPAWFRSAVAGS